jgi:phage host-nuclease inhibitor protein Gam
MPNKPKLISVALVSREAMEAAVADVVQLKLRHTQLTAAMEEEMAAVQKKHQDGILELRRDLEAKEASVYTYCQRHRYDLFPDKKSLDTLLAEVGFELTPPRVEKKGSRDTWSAIARRLQSLDWAGDKYVRESAPEVDKNACSKTAAGSRPRSSLKWASSLSRTKTFSSVPGATWPRTL